jgi:hypothetical protein
MGHVGLLPPGPSPPTGAKPELYLIAVPIFFFCSARGVLPVKGDAIEVQWTEHDGDYGTWFPAEVLQPGVSQQQARLDGRGDRLAKFHRIQHSGSENLYEWVLLH